VVYLEVVESEHALRMCERKGGWDYAHASALGKAILAFSPPAIVDSFLESGALPKLTSRTLTDAKALRDELQKTRRRGYALEREESRMDASCVAAAIYGTDGFAIAGISISGPVSRFNPSKDKRIATVLTEAAQQISVALAEQIGHPVPNGSGMQLSI
jgi:IclR family acetate operon transcriptional repressor